MMQHITKGLLWLCCFIGLIFYERSIYNQIWALAVVLCSYQFTKDLSIDRILIMNRMKHFYFMSAFSQAICNGKYVVIIRTCGIQTHH